MVTKGERTKRHIVNTATALVHRQGLNNTTIDDVLMASGTTKGTFYFHFPSKEALGYAIIEAAENLIIKGLEQIFNDPALPPREKITTMLNNYIALIGSFQCTGGCLFGNLTLEMADINEGYRKRLAEVFGRWIGLVAGALEEMKKREELPGNTNSEKIARFIVSSLEGGTMMCKLRRQTGPLKETKEMIISELDRLENEARKEKARGIKKRVETKP